MPVCFVFPAPPIQSSTKRKCRFFKREVDSMWSGLGWDVWRACVGASDSNGTLLRWPLLRFHAFMKHSPFGGMGMFAMSKLKHELDVETYALIQELQHDLVITRTWHIIGHYSGLLVACTSDRHMQDNSGDGDLSSVLLA